MLFTPTSLIEFQHRFADEAACAAWLYEMRWRDGFVCPRCGNDKAWALETKAFTYECTRCHRQTSVTSGTVMHGSKLPLTVWFWAAFLMTTHSNGISALQLQGQLGLGSYKTAWLLCAKLRRAMVDSDRSPLQGLVEVDETAISCRSKQEPVMGGQGRSHQGKLLVAGAVEVDQRGRPGRLRLARIEDYSAKSLHLFVERSLAPTTIARTDGWSGYQGVGNTIPGLNHQPHTIGPMAAHIVLPWVHRAFSNLKTWGLGVYHGLRAKHLQTYLDEFVFRFNRRRNRHSAFKTILAIAVKKSPMTYNMLISPEQKG